MAVGAFLPRLQPKSSTVPDVVVVPAGGGPLGHPKIFINLVCLGIALLALDTEPTSQDQPGSHPCGYVAANSSEFP